MTNKQIDFRGGVWHWIGKPKDKYQIKVNPVSMVIMIADNKGRYWNQLTFNNFVKYTQNYNDSVGKFPNYVHQAVWCIYNQIINGG